MGTIISFDETDSVETLTPPRQCDIERRIRFVPYVGGVENMQDQLVDSLCQRQTINQG